MLFLTIKDLKTFNSTIHKNNKHLQVKGFSLIKLFITMTTLKMIFKKDVILCLSTLLPNIS